MITDIEIKDELYNLIKGSDLANEVTGKLCKRKRPKNSEGEDIVISVLANVNGQRQEASANVNIYVQDIFNEDNDQYEEDSIRLRTLSEMAWKLLLVGRFGSARFSLDEQRLIDIGDESTHWHVINNKLNIVQINE